MTNTARTQAARLTAAVALTLAAFAGSVSVAGVAAADTAVPPASSVTAPAPAPAPAAPVADKDGKDDEDDDDDKDDDGKGREDKSGKDDPQPVTYVNGDVVDDLGNLVLKKAPKLAPRFEAVAPKLRTALADHLVKKGAQVAYDARGRLIIAPYLCDPKKLKLLQPGCVTSLPAPGGDRF